MLGDRLVDRQANNTPITLLKIATATLFLAIIPIWPYVFYTLLRLLICSISVYLVHKAKGIKKLQSQKILLIIIAFLFNPLFPVYFFRLVWLPIDLATGVCFLNLIGKLKEKNYEI